MRKESLKEAIRILSKEIGKAENEEVQVILADCLLEIAKEIYEDERISK